MKPTIKANRKMTVHRDQTISFWSVLRQQWHRWPEAAISDADLATMPRADRDAVLRVRRG
jgi:hypothetical protein